MLDLRWIRQCPEAFESAMRKKCVDIDAKAILDLDEQHRNTQTDLQRLQNERNTLSAVIGKKKSRGENADAELAKMAHIKDQLQSQAVLNEQTKQQLDQILVGLPNIPSHDVPMGKTADDNRLLRAWGQPKHFDFEPLAHEVLGEKLGGMSFEHAAKMSGARFVMLQGALARLERALAQFMLDLHSQEFGYTETNPPLMVKENAVFGTGQLPKFKADLFQTTEGYFLIPTAEVPLTNCVADEILNPEILPLRMVSYTPCFRSEAGAAGKDTRGMIRQHQFSKVELVSITQPNDSEAEHERMTQCAEEVLKRLGLAYRVMILCGGDMGFAAAKTYDLEVWIPSQKTYREISSCSNCGDFQARRMKARYRHPETNKVEFVHTLNGSGVAVGRCLVAVIENYQNMDGSLTVPDALVPYMGGVSRIEVDG